MTHIEEAARSVARILDPAGETKLLEAVEAEIAKRDLLASRPESFYDLTLISSLATLVITAIGVAHQIITHRPAPKTEKEEKEFKNIIQDELENNFNIDPRIEKVEIVRVSEIIVREVSRKRIIIK